MKFILALTFLIPSMSFANALFTVSKTYKEKNVLHYKAVVKNCKLVAPYVTTQWVMGAEKGQLEGLTNQEKKFFEPKVGYAKDTEADFTLGAMKELNLGANDFKKITIQMKGCKAIAVSDYKNDEITVKNIHLQASLLSVSGATITGTKANGSRFILNVKK